MPGAISPTAAIRPQLGSTRSDVTGPRFKENIRAPWIGRKGYLAFDLQLPAGARPERVYVKSVELWHKKDAGSQAHRIKGQFGGWVVPETRGGETVCSFKFERSGVTTYSRWMGARFTPNDRWSSADRLKVVARIRLDGPQGKLVTVESDFLPPPAELTRK